MRRELLLVVAGILIAYGVLMARRPKDPEADTNYSESREESATNFSKALQNLDDETLTARINSLSVEQALEMEMSNSGLYQKLRSAKRLRPAYALWKKSPGNFGDFKDLLNITEPRPEQLEALNLSPAEIEDVFRVSKAAKNEENFLWAYKKLDMGNNESMFRKYISLREMVSTKSLSLLRKIGSLGSFSQCAALKETYPTVYGGKKDDSHYEVDDVLHQLGCPAVSN